MAVIMINELPGAGPEFVHVARQHGLFSKMKSAPGGGRRPARGRYLEEHGHPSCAATIR